MAKINRLELAKDSARGLALVPCAPDGATIRIVLERPEWWPHTDPPCIEVSLCHPSGAPADAVEIRCSDGQLRLVPSQSNVIRVWAEPHETEANILATREREHLQKGRIEKSNDY